jgi:hypothetical protein
MYKYRCIGLILKQEAVARRESDTNGYIEHNVSKENDMSTKGHSMERDYVLPIVNAVAERVFGNAETDVFESKAMASLLEEAGVPPSNIGPMITALRGVAQEIAIAIRSDAEYGTAIGRAAACFAGTQDDVEQQVRDQLLDKLGKVAETRAMMCRAKDRKRSESERDLEVDDDEANGCTGRGFANTGMRRSTSPLPERHNRGAEATRREASMHVAEVFEREEPPEVAREIAKIAAAIIISDGAAAAAAVDLMSTTTLSHLGYADDALHDEARCRIKESASEMVAERGAAQTFFGNDKVLTRDEVVKRLTAESLSRNAHADEYAETMPLVRTNASCAGGTGLVEPGRRKWDEKQRKAQQHGRHAHSAAARQDDRSAAAHVMDGWQPAAGVAARAPYAPSSRGRKDVKAAAAEVSAKRAAGAGGQARRAGLVGSLMAKLGITGGDDFIHCDDEAGDGAGAAAEPLFQQILGKGPLSFVWSDFNTEIKCAPEAAAAAADGARPSVEAAAHSCTVIHKAVAGGEDAAARAAWEELNAVRYTHTSQL